MKSIKALVGLALVFILGAGSGSLATYLLARPHFETARHGTSHSREERLVRKLTERLSLDNRQQLQVQAIVRDTHEKIQNVRRRTRPEIDALLADSQRRIGLCLRSDQQQAFQGMLAERKTRGHRHGQ